MKKIKANLQDLIDAFGSCSFEQEYYLDIRTGEVILLIDEKLTGEDESEIREKIKAGYNKRYFRFPDASSREGYQDMAAFTEELKDEDLKEKLQIALDGKGAFRRFKDVVLRYPEKREEWFKFKDNRIKERLMEWMKENGLELEEKDNS